MKKYRRAFQRFCFRNRNKGIPNLMLYISLGSALVYFLSMISQSNILYAFLYFDRTAILHGQIWRLFTYAFTFGLGNGNVLLVFIGLFCYYSLGRAIEATWGTFKFNLFYLTGILLMDIYALIFGGHADVYYLNMSLFLSYATLYPDSGFLLFFIIPVKAWIFALIDLLVVVIDFVTLSFPNNLFPIIALMNYFLFFGKDVLNILPRSWRTRMGIGRNTTAKKTQPIVFVKTTNVQKEAAPNYTHRCTVCGRTDVSNPELDFRYCSKCNGYYCYCSDHINNHVHIQ